MKKEISSFITKNKYLIFILLLVFCIFQYGIEKICGFTMYPDEFGYWASAANVVGYDWSEVASLGSYYSFGYSLVLIPLLKLFQNGVSAYRAAIAINMCFMCIGMFLLLQILRRIFPNISNIKRVFISGIAVMYPPWIFYTQMTLAESLLMVLYISICWLLICLIQKPNVLTAIALAVTLVYLYSVHMRTVGIIIACLIMLVLWGLSNPSIRKQLLVFLAVLFGACVIVLIIKRNVVLQVFSYADAETLSVNDYGSQWNKFRQILSPSGIIQLLIGILGKVFYLGLASFGTFYWALIWSLKETILLLKKIWKKRECYIQNWVAVFLFLSVVGEILISSIYMHGSVKVDCLLYGRYNEFLMPVLMVFGIAIMYRSKKLFQGMIMQGVISGLMIPALLYYINKNQMQGIRGYFVAGISYVLDEPNFEPVDFLVKAWLFGWLLMAVMAVLIWISKRIRGAAWMTSVVIVIEILLGLHVSYDHTYQVNKSIYPDLLISETIAAEGNEQDEVVYLNEDAYAFVSFQQMQLLDKSIKVATEEQIENLEEMGRFLIVYKESKYVDLLKKQYDNQVISPSFYLYYNDTPTKE